MKIQRVLGTVLASGALLALTSETSFAESTYRGGTHCRPTGGGTYALWGGGVMNTSTTQDLALFCPLIKEEAAARPYINVGYFDRHPTKVVSCRLVSEEYIGEIVFSYDQTYGDSSAAPDAHFHSFQVTHPQLPPGDVLYALCSVPPAHNNNLSLLMSFSVAS